MSIKGRGFLRVKVAFITGAAGGIGSATVKKFISEDYFVIGQYCTNVQGVKQLQEQLEQMGKADYFFAVQCDFNDFNSVENMLCTVRKSFKTIDVLVNNAGTGLYKLINQTTESDWDNLFNVNVKSAFRVTNGVLDGMISAKKGKIINVSSIWGNVGASMEVAYSASKGALIAYTKALAKELAPSGICVNCVCPGVIDTPMNARFNEQEINELKEQTPLSRLGKAKEVAELIYYLSSDKADFITGQIMTCDGGMTL